MQTIFSLLTLYLFYKISVYIHKKISAKEGVSLYHKPYKIIKESGHGHRCYLEGLSFSEREVVNILAHTLDSKKYFIFNNIILPTQDGYSSQIDHLVVSVHGVFVIESKDMSGWIFGSEFQKTWTQSLPSAVKYHFQNPLHQNYGHIMSLLYYISNIQKEKFFLLSLFQKNHSLKHPSLKMSYTNNILVIT